MKNSLNKAFILLFLFVFSGCYTFTNSINEGEEVVRITKELITALEKDDEESIKAMFAENVRSKELEKQIEQMCDFFDGDFIVYFGLNSPSGSSSMRNGKVTKHVISNAGYNHIETNKDIYKISFSTILVDGDEPKNEGIWRIWIGTSDENYLIVGNSNLP